MNFMGEHHIYPSSTGLSLTQTMTGYISVGLIHTSTGRELHRNRRVQGSSLVQALPSINCDDHTLKIHITLRFKHCGSTFAWIAVADSFFYFGLRVKEFFTNY